jgi:hypothetical protein
MPPGLALDCVTRLHHGDQKPRDVGQGRIEQEEIRRHGSTVVVFSPLVMSLLEAVAMRPVRVRRPSRLGAHSQPQPLSLLGLLARCSNACTECLQIGVGILAKEGFKRLDGGNQFRVFCSQVVVLAKYVILGPS